MAYNNVHLPVGYEVAVQTDPSVAGVYTDLGVTMDDGELTVSYDELKITGSRAEGLIRAFKNFSVEMSATLAQIELSNVNKLMSGASAYAPVDATPAAPSTDTYAIAGWSTAKFIPFLNQNGAGTVPATITVESPASTTLTLNTDYSIVQNENGVWGIILIDTEPVNPAANALLVKYTHTPAASRGLTMGSASVSVTPRAFRIRKLLATGKYFTVIIYSAVNTAGLSLAFPRYDNDSVTTLPITIRGECDVTRSDLDQLLSITDQYGIIDN